MVISSLYLEKVYFGRNNFYNDMKCFKLSLKRFLCHHSFYSIEEYYEHTDDKTCKLTVILILFILLLYAIF